MLFNSYQFVIFLPIVVMGFFLVPHRWRALLLLAASYFFYMQWQPAYAILLGLSTLGDYLIGLGMSGSDRSQHRRMWLVLSLVMNLGVLFAFKYYGFAGRAVRIAGDMAGAGWELPALRVLLPVGISFFTFQKLSYVIELYRRKIDVEKHFVTFALYVSFFPQLVAGPIERADELLPQFKIKQVFEWERAVNGLKLIAWGLFKKVVIADRLALVVNQVYGTPQDYMGFHLVLATFLFAYQIYCDFSGYSDIAIGAAQIMGFRLMNNFDRPYFAQSIPEFWRRWHISLSSWFRDYVYFPLGGSRISLPRWYFNLMVVFILSGLWHGADFTFLAWGILHGIYMVVGVAFQMHMKGSTNPSVLLTVLRRLGVFVLVGFAWIFFRANCITEALVIVRRLPVGWRGILGGGTASISSALHLMGTSGVALGLSLGLIAFLELISYSERQNAGRTLMAGRPAAVRWLFYVLIVFTVLDLGVSESVPFIYFQF